MGHSRNRIITILGIATAAAAALLPSQTDAGGPPSVRAKAADASGRKGPLVISYGEGDLAILGGRSADRLVIDRESRDGPVSIDANRPIRLQGDSCRLVTAKRAECDVGNPGAPLVELQDGADWMRIDARIPFLIWGEAGDDTLIGGPRADGLYGVRGDDRLLGRAGPDTLKGGRGQDQLRGSKGGESLDGGPDRDRCTGGQSRDTREAC